MSDQQQNGQDDQERDRGQGSGEQRDPTQQPPTHQEGDRKVGDEGQEQGSEPPRGDEHVSTADQALENERDSIDSGHETPA